MNEEENEDMEMINEPLTTEEGFLNPACMNELTDAIMNMPKTHDRLAGNSEWSEKKDNWTTRKEIVAHFARWACEISPYGVSDGIENVCKYLYTSLASCAPWDVAGMSEVSLCDINKWLHEILYEQGVKEFDAWNVPKKGKPADISFTSSYDGETDPDYDFIDLDALLHNVCISIRDERRTSNASHKAFDEKYGSLSVEELTPAPPENN